MEASCGVKDSSAMMQFEWKVSDIVFKESVLIATETLKFGSKVNSPKQSQKITKIVSYLVLWSWYVITSGKVLFQLRFRESLRLVKTQCKCSSLLKLTINLCTKYSSWNNYWWIIHFKMVLAQYSLKYFLAEGNWNEESYSLGGHLFIFFY